MDAFGPALAGADHLVLTDIYAAGEDPIAGRHARRARRGRPAQRRRRRSTSCRALDDVVPARRRDRAAGRRRDHAGRRLDRRRCADRLDARCSRREALREPRSPRRPIGGSGARTSSRRASAAGWRALARPAAEVRRSSSLLASTRVYRGGSVVAACRACCRSIDIVVRGNERCRTARCWRCSAGCAARTSSGPTSTAWRAPAAGVAVGARRGAAALAAVDGRGGRDRAAADRHRPDRRRAVSRRRTGRGHRRVRAAVRRLRPADRRRPAGVDRRRRIGDRRTRAPSWRRG